MFFLSLIEHTLRLPPHLLDLSLDKTIQGELESQFLDKVIADLGLCISVYDIRSIDGDFAFPADGASTYTIRFQVQSVSYSPVPVEQPKESKPFAPMVILVSSSFELHPFKVFHL
ncbi:hypothetical protein VitviT2T_009211 [Vitis vinifera]|uniref:DNA-directed RNA polymerase subunit n=1 Tax=Vitis vinifera TaxID=29760 RepID=A0ABY9C799_VITVI|nr:uncharacterized protein LOC100263195 isoform X1 [Vitis vinifera]WJZ90035.1 hypothetical protein VitviT2T_009211 [Vitis vinifera]